MENYFLPLLQWHNICILVFFLIIGFLWRKIWRKLDDDHYGPEPIDYIGLIFLTFLLTAGSIAIYKFNLFNNEIIGIILVFFIAVLILLWIWIFILLIKENEIPIIVISLLFGLMLGWKLGIGNWILLSQIIIVFMLGIGLSYLYPQKQPQVKIKS